MSQTGVGKDRIPRRDFNRKLVLGAGLSGGIASSFAASVAADSGTPPAPSLPEDAQPKKEAGLPPEVLLLTYLIQKYPNDHFDEAAIQGIYRDIRGDIARGQALAEFPLRNSDEPAFVYSAFQATTLTPPNS